MKLRNQYILIKVDEPVEKNEAGLYLNSDSVKIPNTGEVIDLASDVTDLKKGDKVHFLRYASIDGIENDTRLCKPEHIIAVL